MRRTHSTQSAEKQEGQTPAGGQQIVTGPGSEQAGVLTALLGFQQTYGNRFVQRLLADTGVVRSAHASAEATANGSHDAPPEVEAGITRTRGSGHELQPTVRRSMEQAFGADFSGVRLHTDTTADTLSQSISAHAFTTGRDIYFRQGAYDPAGASGRKLLAHELTHVVQQGGSAAPIQGKLEIGPPGDRYEQEADRMAEAVTAGTAVQTMCPDCEEEGGFTTLSSTAQRAMTPDRADDRNGFQTAATMAIEPGAREDEFETAAPSIQRDFAIEPPNASAEATELTDAQVQAAIRYNTMKLRTADADMIRLLRDVLGISHAAPDIDEELARAIGRWQAANNLPQDGKLGPDTAAPLFAELRAEGLTAEARTLAGIIRRGRVRTGPTYTPNGTLAPTAIAGGKTVHFDMAAEFEHDPENGIFASCCEVRQEIEWDATAAASFTAILGAGVVTPHNGFPAAHPADTRIEDRNAGDTARYGHRGGFGGGVAGNRYLNAAGALRQATGRRFEAQDNPTTPTAHVGQWRFRLSVVDVCNENRRVGGTDNITINW